MSLAYIASIRLSTRGDALGKVRVAFELSHDGSALEAVFECMSCADLLHWVPFCSSWECDHCGYLLDASDANSVATNASALLKTFTADVNKKANKRWGWVMWLRRLLRLKGASKSLSA